MYQPRRDEFFAAIGASAGRLATHVDRVHRWAGEIVGTSATERVVDAIVAADGTDEWLATVTSPRYRGRDAAEWVIRRTGEGPSPRRGPGRGLVSVSGWLAHTSF